MATILHSTLYPSNLAPNRLVAVVNEGSKRNRSQHYTGTSYGGASVSRREMGRLPRGGQDFSLWHLRHTAIPIVGLGLTFGGCEFRACFTA